MVVTLRRALATDQPTIRKMVRDARLDITSLHWSQFTVAEVDGEVVGIGQIRPHENCPELGSLIVLPHYRGQGIGKQLMNALTAQVEGRVYLECESSMVSYYQRFGFKEVSIRNIPSSPLRRKARIGNIIVKLLGKRIAVMVNENT